MDYKRIVVVGGGKSGIAAARLAGKMGSSVVLLEREVGVIDHNSRKVLKDLGVKIKEGEHRKEDFRGADLVVLSPGVVVHHIKKYVNEIPIISEVEFGFWFLKDEYIIGITGTNGKTTTVGIISWVLKKQKKEHFVGGNFGIPLCEYILQDRKRIVLLELSSFQLQNILYFKPNIGVFLNFSENHLDYHKDVNEYFMCKMNIFKNQTRDDIAIINLSLKKHINKYTINSKIKYFSNVGAHHANLGARHAVPLQGEHNLENMAAAMCVCEQLGIERDKFLDAAYDFSPFPHRIEYVCEINGVEFYNDSKSTTLESIRAAVKSFHGKVFLISGGILKGGDPKRIIDSIKDRVSAACVYGQSADTFFNAWKDDISVYKVRDIKQAVEFLFPMAKKGDVILLSPGCSSFDMFSSYKDRGNHFKQIVMNLKEDKIQDN